MSTETKNGCLLLFRGNEWHKGLSLEQMEKVSRDWMAWFQRLMEEGKCAGGHPLEPQGRTVSGANARVVADGPFAESKEAIGGYFFLKVNTLEEAVAIARECPGLPYGAVVEVRPVGDECPIGKEARLEMQQLAQSRG